jgi:hypothetical protein
MRPLKIEPLLSRFMTPDRRCTVSQTGCITGAVAKAQTVSVVEGSRSMTPVYFVAGLRSSIKIFLAKTEAFESG